MSFFKFNKKTSKLTEYLHNTYRSDGCFTKSYVVFTTIFHRQDALVKSNLLFILYIYINVLPIFIFFSSYCLSKNIFDTVL